MTEKEKNKDSDIRDLFAECYSGTFRRLSGCLHLQREKQGVLECADRKRGADEPASDDIGEWMKGLSYLFPILSFALGVLVAERIGHRYKKAKRIHWRQIVVMIEIIILFVVGFIPHRYDMIATMLVSFSCSMQVQSFRKVNGYGYASTMCIGNLRSGTESLSIYLRDRNIGALKKTAHYYGIILIFAIGAGIGGVCSLHIGIRAIWASSVLLAIVCTMMVREHR